MADNKANQKFKLKVKIDGEEQYKSFLKLHSDGRRKWCTPSSDEPWLGIALPNPLCLESQLTQLEALPHLPGLSSMCTSCSFVGKQHASNCTREKKTSAKQASAAKPRSFDEWRKSSGASSTILSRTKAVPASSSSATLQSSTGPANNPAVATSTTTGAVGQANQSKGQVEPESPQPTAVATPATPGEGNFSAIQEHTTAETSQEGLDEGEELDEQENEDEELKSLQSRLQTVIKQAWKGIPDKVKRSYLKIPFPCDLQGSSAKSMRPELVALTGSTFFHWDPKNLVPDLMGDCILHCPACEKPLIGNGDAKVIKIERTMGFAPHLLVSKALECQKCESPLPGSISRHWSNSYPEVLSQMPESVRDLFPFVNVVKGSLISCPTLTAVQSLVGSATAFEAICTAALAATTTRLLDLEKARRSRFKQYAKNAGLLQSFAGFASSNGKALQGNAVAFARCFSVTPGLLKRRFIDEYNRQKSTIQGSFYKAILASDSLHIDMVHFWGNDGSKEGAVGVWVMLNKYGEVVAVRSAASKSLEDAAGLLKEIAVYAAAHDHKIKIVYTDNPEVDATQIRATFGQDALVRKDIFHIIAGLLDLTKKTAKNRLGWEAAVVNCFWTFIGSDVEMERRRMKSAGVSNYE